jgi:hypothetical protein
MNRDRLAASVPAQSVPAHLTNVARVLASAAAIVTVAAPMLQAQQSPTSAANLVSSDASRPTLRALRVARAPVIDGRLSDEAWSHAPVADHFRQRDPHEGQAATERTEIRVLYDDNALYVGARLYDTDPARISRRLTARDEHPDADSVSSRAARSSSVATPTTFWTARKTGSSQGRCRRVMSAEVRGP